MSHVSHFIWSICLLFLIVNTHTLVESVDCNNLDKYLYIRNGRAGLVLDAINGTYISVEVANSSVLTQQWQLYPSSKIGLFNIVNRDSGMALDVDSEFAVINALDDNIYQQWFINANKTIGNNGLSNTVLDLNYSADWAGNQIFLNRFFRLFYNAGDQVYSLEIVQ